MNKRIGSGDHEWERRWRDLESKLDIHAGDLYEDSALHPCLCIEIDYANDDIAGVSLADGSHPRSCSLLNSGIRKLTINEAWQQKLKIEGQST